MIATNFSIVSIPLSPVVATLAGVETCFLAWYGIAGLSVCQLIYMSEVGVIIMRSSLPLGFADLVAIFLLRTVIVLRVLVVGAFFVVG